MEINEFSGVGKKFSIIPSVFCSAILECCVFCVAKALVWIAMPKFQLVESRVELNEYLSGLEIAHITSTLILLARNLSRGQHYLQGQLWNTIFTKPHAQISRKCRRWREQIWKGWRERSVNILVFSVTKQSNHSISLYIFQSLRNSVCNCTICEFWHSVWSPLEWLTAQTKDMLVWEIFYFSFNS